MSNPLQTLGGAASMVNPVVGGAFSVGSTLLSGMFSRHQQERAAQLAASQSIQNADVQRNLWETSLREGKAREVSGMKAAGLNPAMAQDSGQVNGLSSAPGSPVPANPVNVQNPIEGMLAGSQVGLVNSQKDRQDIENKYLPQQLAAGIRETLAAAGASEKTVELMGAQIDKLGIDGALALGQLDLVMEQTTSTEWQRVNDRLRLYLDAALTESKIDLNDAQAEQLRTLTPALFKQAMAQGNLNDALAKVAGLLGDPEKAAQILKAWITTVKNEVPKIIETLNLGEMGKRSKNLLLKGLGKLHRWYQKYFTDDGQSAHRAFVKSNGSSGHTPMQWRPRWHE